ncbi:MAG: hypothetical protein QF732_09460 [Nitrospinaceae bacterium]|jgi:hypothetical protein|nr:hypothetical protein [Nitrospinaceae bacterium]|tara:strand:- start:301 stop:966 length:666 start_codon:yes stop_codon:yes gene_type:complete
MRVTDKIIYRAKYVVPEAGHEWIETENLRGSDATLFLTNNSPVGSDLIGRVPSFNNQTIFREFSELDPTHKAVKRFADTWGNLGPPASEAIKLPDGGIGHGSILENWKLQIDGMKKTIDAFENGSDELRANFKAVLNEHLKQYVSVHYGEHLEIIVNGVMGLVWFQFARWRDGEFLHRRCEICRSWFEVKTTGKGNSQHKRYCSGKCRMAASRLRNKEKNQ